MKWSRQTRPSRGLNTFLDASKAVMGEKESAGTSSSMVKPGQQLKGSEHHNSRFSAIFWIKSTSSAGKKKDETVYFTPRLNDSGNFVRRRRDIRSKRHFI